MRDEPELPAGLSLGMPPANRPPNCGGPALPTEAIVGTLCPTPPLATPPPPLGAATAGALRSFVTAFLSFFPAWICFKSSLDAMVDKVDWG